MEGLSFGDACKGANYRDPAGVYTDFYLSVKPLMHWYIYIYTYMYMYVGISVEGVQNSGRVTYNYDIFRGLLLWSLGFRVRGLRLRLRNLSPPHMTSPQRVVEKQRSIPKSPHFFLASARLSKRALRLRLSSPRGCLP